jgi:hypothetical protein
LHRHGVILYKYRRNGGFHTERQTNVYPNLDVEQTRRGHSAGDVAETLGITLQEYRARKDSGAFSLAEALRLAEMYDKPVDYLLRLGV